MYKKIFEVKVPYRMPDDPTLTGYFGKQIDPIQSALLTTPPRIYGEQFLQVNALLVKKEATATSPVTITLNVMARNIYYAFQGQTLKYDGATGAFMGYGDLIGDSLDNEIVQSQDGSLWSTKNVGPNRTELHELDTVTYAVINTIPCEFFEIPADQLFHGITHPMVDRPRGIIVMAGYPADADGRYILVYAFATGSLIRRIWVSGPVVQIMQEDDRRCFVVCSNGIINLVDYTTGKIISTTRTPVAGGVSAFRIIYAWDFVLRRLLAFNFVDGSFFGAPINADGSSSNTITGYYPVPIATNITKPIPLKPPRKGITVPMLVRAVGDAGEPIPSLPIAVTATAPGAIGPGARVTDSYGYATINLIGTDTGLSEVTASANVDDGAAGTASGGGAGGSTGSAAPILSLPAAAQTGTSTATGTVSTDQNNGSLYTLVSASATAAASDVKAGQVQAVTVAGTQNVSIVNLAASTTYYPHYLHRNSAGQESAVVTGASFTTAAAGTSTGTGTGTASGGGQSAQPIAVGSQIAPLSIENISTNAATNQPLTIGHVFARGHLPLTDAGITVHLADGTTIPAQLNVKASHDDGSVRHAIISAILPAIASSATALLSIRRASAAAGTNVSLPASLPSATLNIGGTLYTAAPTSSTPHTTWFAGSVASDFIFNMPFATAGGTPHPTLTAQFSVRVYSTGHVRVDYVIEHCKAFSSTADIAYDVTLYANGQPVYTRTALVHTPAGRWKRTFWQGVTPTLHVKHDINYLIDSRQVPNYDRSITIQESMLVGYAAELATNKFDPMQFGRLNPVMGSTGGRPELGLMPDTYAATLLSMDKRAKAIMLATADTSGSWPAFRRDDSNGPGTGLPLSVKYFPYASILGAFSDCDNPATGKNEHLPELSTATQGDPDSSHQAAFCYLPYLLTGDFHYLEGLHFWCNFNHYRENPYYRDFGLAHVRADQVRGQAWSLRTLAECAAITPDDHPSKQMYNTWYDNNINWFNNAYLDAPNPTYANQLGIITNGYALGYDMNGATKNGMAPWMDDFFTASLGHGIELLGHAGAKRFMAWKARFQIGRLVDPGTCITDAAIYTLGVRQTMTSPFFTTLAECMTFSVPSGEQQYACNSSPRLAYHPNCQPGDIDGYPGTTEGFPSNYQIGLAAAVDSGYPGGSTAWHMFIARPTKPDYGRYGAQFAVVPR